jgi:hypothetical protein
MKIKSIAQSIIFSFIACGAVFNPNLLGNAQSGRGRADFICGQDNNGRSATIAVRPNGEQRIFIVWETYDFGEEYPPDVRCRMVSNKFQQNQRNEILNYIVEGRFNNYPVLCASPTPPTDSVINCTDSRVLLTLRPGKDDPQKAIKAIRDVNTGVSELPWQQTAEIIVESPNRTKIGIDVQQLIFFSSPLPEEEEGGCLFGPC